MHACKCWVLIQMQESHACMNDSVLGSVKKRTMANMSDQPFFGIYFNRAEDIRLGHCLCPRTFCERTRSFFKMTSRQIATYLSQLEAACSFEFADGDIATTLKKRTQKNVYKKNRPPQNPLC